MSVNYKYKPNKHMFRVDVKTIDELHNEHLEEFNKNKESIPSKEKQLENYENELKILSDKNVGEMITFENIRKMNELRRNITKLKEDIKNAKSYNNEMIYYSRAGEVLSDYYGLTNGILYGTEKLDDSDNKNNDPKPSNKIDISDKLIAITNMNKKRKLKKPVRKRGTNVETVPTKTIMSFLINDEDDDKSDEELESKHCKASLQEEYLLIIDKEYACSKSKISMSKKCKNPNCKGADKIIVYNESLMTCPKCGESEEIFIESEIPSSRETSVEKPKYPYKRIGHCIEKLNQFLCKGNINVPDEVFDILEEELYKLGFTKEQLSIDLLEKLLKKHRLSEHSGNAMYIYCQITKTPPPNVSTEEYNLALQRFTEADELYEKKYKPKGRNNFMKYTVALNGIFFSMGRRDIASQFKLLKNDNKNRAQRKIWINICAEKGWDYDGQ
jgi:hypothetical protein